MKDRKENGGLALLYYYYRLMRAYNGKVVDFLRTAKGVCPNLVYLWDHGFTSFARLEVVGQEFGGVCNLLYDERLHVAQQ